MSNFIQNLKNDFKSKAKKGAVVKGPSYRFTVLTSKLIRMEYDSQNNFEDRASQVFWYRDLPVPEFEVRRNDNKIDIETDDLHLKYEVNDAGFSPETLTIKLKCNDKVWHYGDKENNNLMGTTRTLDGINGEVTLEKGLISKDGWTVIDDSNTLVFNQSGWLEKRDKANSKETKDIYFWGYGKDYIDCLNDFSKVSGRSSLIPRWALGNWWSRFWKYSQEELENLMLEFKNKEIPLSVCIIDMDWHIVENDYNAGWTGYTWNKDLFPNPDDFIGWLHNEGLKTALNLHPADGVYPHEEAYQKMAKFMDIDPDSKEAIEFDICNPKFIEGYFKILHHPLEEQGVDFWWMDWQQGTKTKIEGLDPLWALNHLHFYDRARNEKKRPFIFSRWGGLGHHRYPIGFSGDTSISWESLEFQPYFTATAANVGYGWWSHDIGGHRMGCEEPELYLRWVQFGVFSPIMRLHSNDNAYLNRSPWTYREDIYQNVKEVMRLRHALIPYLYTMVWRNVNKGITLITPMYYYHAEKEEAYVCPNQYYFGSELVVAPYLTPQDEDTNLSRRVVWLPKGDWFDFFTGEYYKGDKWYSCYGELKDVPVFAKAGAIIPLSSEIEFGKVDNPQIFDLLIFPGSDNDFLLYEDDGESLEYQDNDYVLTEFNQKWFENKMIFKINKPSNKKEFIPEQRKYRLTFRGIKKPDQITIRVNGKKENIDIEYNEEQVSLIVNLPFVSVDDEIKIKLEKSECLISKRDFRLNKIKKLLTNFKLDTMVKPILEEKIMNNINQQNLDYLKPFKPILKKNHFRALLEILSEIGIDRINIGDQNKIIMWNNNQREDVNYQYYLKDSFNNTYKNYLVKNNKILDLKSWKDQEWCISFEYSDLCTVFYNN